MRDRGGEHSSPAVFHWRSDSKMLYMNCVIEPNVQYVFRRVCGGHTLHSELDEPSTLSIGVDGVAGEEDRIPSLGRVQL